MFSTAPFFRTPLRDAFRHIAAGGFDRVEVMVTSDPATQEAHLMLPLAEEFGLRIEAIHAPFLLITRRVWGSDPTGKIYRAVHLAEDVGAGLVVIIKNVASAYIERWNFVLGAIFVVIVVFMPEGLVPGVVRLTRRALALGHRAAPAAVAATGP